MMKITTMLSLTLLFALLSPQAQANLCSSSKAQLEEVQELLRMGDDLNAEAKLTEVIKMMGQPRLFKQIARGECRHLYSLEESSLGAARSKCYDAGYLNCQKKETFLLNRIKVYATGGHNCTVASIVVGSL